MTYIIIRNSILRRNFHVARILNQNKPASYGSTLHLPKTSMPLKRNENTCSIEKRLDLENIYKWQRTNLPDSNEFILHDGPPYANGDVHLGHSVNKILKDILGRYELLKGRKLNFKPGWDCHGLPIEIKALKGSSTKNLNNLEIRQKARQFAIDAVEKQRNEFKKWAILADWKNPYITSESNYIIKEIQMFEKLYNKGFIFRAEKPVFWSPSTQTALAEAELEYSSHKSACAYIQIPLIGLKYPEPCSALIWTTQPWTIPANEGLGICDQLEYCLVRNSEVKDQLWLIAFNCLESVQTNLGMTLEPILRLSSNELKDVRYKHPWILNKEGSLLKCDHVTDNKGTGIVHLAPGHGHDDFLEALRYQLPIVSVVNEKGLLTKLVGSEFENLDALRDGNKAIIDRLKESGALVAEQTINHSYPYDWRTNKPVIIRASWQWFIDTRKIEELAEQALQNVQSEWSSQLIQGIRRRSYWCISRQRSWGVPIPALIQNDGSTTVPSPWVAHLCNLIQKHGPDFRWSLNKNELVPKELNLDGEPSTDILDIWLDSGLSWSIALDNGQSSAVLEGIDQINAWFQTSLLTSVALQGKAPFKELLVHGFTVDSKGRKMSKSVGNVTSPESVVKEIGVDGLRWWVAAHAGFNTIVPVNQRTFTESEKNVQKIRATLRYLLGSLSNTSTDGCAKPYYIDRWLIHKLRDLQISYDIHMKARKFPFACREISNFVTNELSAIYFSIIKKRLYCGANESQARLASIQTLNTCLDSLLRLCSPILPFLVEEVQMYRSPEDTSYLMEALNKSPSLLHSDSEALQVIELALKVRDTLYKSSPSIHTPRYKVSVNVPDDLYAQLKILHPAESDWDSESELAELLNVAGAKLELGEKLDVKIELASGALCPRCRRHTAINEEELCPACENDVQRTFATSG